MNKKQIEERFEEIAYQNNSAHAQVMRELQLVKGTLQLLEDRMEENNTKINKKINVLEKDNLHLYKTINESLVVHNKETEKKETPNISIDNQKIIKLAKKDEDGVWVLTELTKQMIDSIIFNYGRNDKCFIYYKSHGNRREFRATMKEAKRVQAFMEGELDE